MEAKPVGNFPILRVRDDDPIVHMVHDGTMVYIAIECTGKSLDELYAIMKGVQSQNTWMPNFLPPTHYQQASRSYLAVECFDKTPLNELRADWYFVRANACYSSSSKRWNPVLLYPTMGYQKLILSILGTVMAFVGTSIRPILDINSMFLSKDNHVIFRRYQLRAVGHDRLFEAQEIISVLNFLVTSKAKTSDTIKAEFAELFKWLVSADSPFGAQPQNDGKLPPLSSALKMVVFWDCRMRINYIQLLGDFVIRNKVAVFPVARDAFGYNWRQVMERQHNPVLTEVLKLGDQYYIERMKECQVSTTSKPPSFLRTDDISSFNPNNVLRSGIIRIRDSFYHIYNMKNEVRISQNKKSDLSDENLQYIYQYIYPSHMIKLAEVQDQMKFNAAGRIFGSYACRME